MNYYIISVSGKRGYSFMVKGDFTDDYDAIEHAASAGLFDDVDDINYAIADDVVTPNDIERFNENDCCYEC